MFCLTSVSARYKVTPMTKDEAIKHFGGQVKLARALRVSQPTVSAWVKVPLHHQNYLEKLTGGILRAEPHPAEIQTEQPS